MVLNDSFSEMLRRELQVRKANNVSWKINNKSRYRQSDPIKHTDRFCKCFLQLNNARNVISSHYVQRGHRRGNKIRHIRGKTCFTFSAIAHITISEINCIMYQDYISGSFKPFPRVCNISQRTFFPL